MLRKCILRLTKGRVQYSNNAAQTENWIHAKIDKTQFKIAAERKRVCNHD